MGDGGVFVGGPSPPYSDRCGNNSEKFSTTLPLGVLTTFGHFRAISSHSSCPTHSHTPVRQINHTDKMAWEEPRKTGMVYRRLGNSGLHVSALGLGGWLTFGGQVENGTLLDSEVSVLR